MARMKMARFQPLVSAVNRVGLTCLLSAEDWAHSSIGHRGRVLWRSWINDDACCCQRLVDLGAGLGLVVCVVVVYEASLVPGAFVLRTAILDLYAISSCIVGSG